MVQFRVDILFNFFINLFFISGPMVMVINMVASIYFFNLNFPGRRDPEAEKHWPFLKTFDPVADKRRPFFLQYGASFK